MKRGILLPLLLLLWGCPPQGERSVTLVFEDVAAEAGIRFAHRNGATGDFNYPELMSGGVSFADIDGDGFLDVYTVQGGELPDDRSSSGDANRLFRNNGVGGFEDVTERSGTGDTRYGTGVVAADYDNDGDIDLYVTNLGRNTLFSNDGDGRFADATEHAGVGDVGYSTAATFVDYDQDGFLDLYVANYIDWAPPIERPCFAPNGLRDYCSPGVYDRPARDTLYRNEGDGTFRNVTIEAGIQDRRGAGLGVIATDLTGDGLDDIFVANDQMPNTLWVGHPDRSFSEQALSRGCALNESGRSEASMGIAIGDVDGDDDWDLFLTHLDGETNTYYRNDAGFFQDVTDQYVLGGISREFTGFGTGFADFDCDGILDLVIANGSVRLGDSMLAGDYGEPNQLFRGTDVRRYDDVSHVLGSPELREVSRGAALGDYDNDGDIDILIGNNEGPVRLYRNDSCRDAHWLGVRLVDGGPGTHGIGAIVTLTTDARRMRRLIQPAYSYGASHDPRAHFGLGDDPGPYEVEIAWPGGRVTTHVIESVDRYIHLSPTSGTPL
ncbi:MAG: CRTAC1 family protein [Acidobacteriota bacterium]|nr:CRTAC1 family protein [Acidobacteriota bacterium]MDH3783939.1 CRTAC1 family protein [Acidobacteriota bacterium]